MSLSTLFKKKKEQAQAVAQSPVPTSETLAQQSTEIGRLPNEDDPDIMDLIRREAEKAKKRKGRASTLLTTDQTRTDTLVSPY